LHATRYFEGAQPKDQGGIDSFAMLELPLGILGYEILLRNDEDFKSKTVKRTIVLGVT
jgi:hypothetical protein